MNKKFDPYEVLGVDRNATEAEIKKAAKQSARKAHPDAGGSDDAFIENRKALAVLSNPEKRAKFDATGAIDEEKPDNSTSIAMQIIISVMAEITNGYLASGFSSSRDPRHFDLIKLVEGKIMDKIDNDQETVRQGKKHAAFLQDFVKRFKLRKKGKASFDFISRQINDEIAVIDAKIAEVEIMIESTKLALELLASYHYDFDKPQSTVMNYYFTTT
jgi:curved DNA-binding protein CbpA